MKIRLVGAELFHVDRRTDRDMTKLIAAFRNFANAPKSWSSIKCGHQSLHCRSQCYRWIWFDAASRKAILC